MTQTENNKECVLNKTENYEYRNEWEPAVYKAQLFNLDCDTMMMMDVHRFERE